MPRSVAVMGEGGGRVNGVQPLVRLLAILRDHRYATHYEESGLASIRKAAMEMDIDQLAM